jgi:phosphoglycolate phosphatase
MMIKPSAVLFDFDDTLIEAGSVIKKSLSATFKQFNIEERSLEDINLNLSLRDYFHQIFSDNLQEAREAYYNHYNIFSQQLKALDNAESVLNFLKNKDIFTAVVSNKGGSRLREEIKDKFAWQNYFHAVVGSGDAAEDKPSPFPALLALQNSGLTNYQDVWFIGDSIVDIQTANKLGCKAILFGGNVIEKKDNIIHHYISNHAKLLELLKEVHA